MNSKEKFIRILHISTNKNGGVGTVVNGLCSYFKNSVSVVLYKEAKTNISIVQQYKELKDEIKLSLKHIDLLHFHGSWAPHIFILRKKQPKPTLISPHGALHNSSLKKSKFKKIIAKFFYVKKTYLNSDCIHALTIHEAKYIKNFGIKNIPIAIVPNGIDFNEKLNIEAKTKDRLLKLAQNRTVILSLSRLDPLKGIDMLIESFYKVLIKNNKLVLFIVGDGSQTYKNKLNKTIEAHKMQNNIFLLGEMNGFYKNTVYDIADLFVLPSYNEGFGLTILEAYRQKTPVITTTATPFKEIEDENIGWYVKPNNEEITAALESAVSLKKQELHNMGEKGFEFMKNKYSLDIVNSKMKKLYSWLIYGGDVPDFVINNSKNSSHEV
jgi:glycosyltransferase involved in cell wall biosynthesis